MNIKYVVSVASDQHFCCLEYAEEVSKNGWLTAQKIIEDFGEIPFDNIGEFSTLEEAIETAKRRVDTGVYAEYALGEQVFADICDISVERTFDDGDKEYETVVLVAASYNLETNIRRSEVILCEEV